MMTGAQMATRGHPQRRAMPARRPRPPIFERTRSPIIWSPLVGCSTTRSLARRSVSVRPDKQDILLRLTSPWEDERV